MLLLKHNAVLCSTESLIFFYSLVVYS